MTSYRDLVYCEDDQFIWNCYRAILGRDPDASGFSHYIAALGQGRARAIVVRSLLHSPEARMRGARVRGVKAAVFWSRLARVPGLGTILSRIERVKDAEKMSNALVRIELDAAKLIELAQEHAAQIQSLPQSSTRRSHVGADEADAGLSPRGRAIFEELRIRG